jgi:hypothetical protein
MSKLVTVSQAVALIRDNTKGTTFVSIDTDTEPRMRKTGNPYHGKVRKLNTMTGCVGFDYENSVNRLASKEGASEREAKSRKWGTLTSDRLFVEHKGNFYVQMKVESSDTPRYIGNDGTEIDVELLRPFLQKSGKSSTQSDLDGEVIVRDVKMVNVKSMRFKGQDYTIVLDGVNESFEYDEISIPAQSVPTVPENIVLAVN